MVEKSLCLGILAHVDAGKTTLTERLLFAAGVVDAMGSVDAGTTQTDSLALERARGITIRAAVAAFAVGDVLVNLIDTPGHPDFIAEVERALGVLDGAVLVVSAVEGVQPQTRLLVRALQRLAVPTLIFVNKIDRAGADPERVASQIRERLTPAAVPLGHVTDAGCRRADYVPELEAGLLAPVLAESDEGILAELVAGRVIAERRLRRSLARHARAGTVHPVLFGSALTGAGTAALTEAVVRLLPTRTARPDGPPGGRAFKIERDANGERVTYVRMFSGTLRSREPVRVAEAGEGKATEIRMFDPLGERVVPALPAGRIGKVRGLAGVRIGDAIGVGEAGRGETFRFAPPTLETVVDPVHTEDGARLHAALARLAEEDPLIDVRTCDGGRAVSVSLFGEVQKQVLAGLLAEQGLAVAFRDVTPLHVERPRRRGEAVEFLHGPGNPYNATIGLRIEPAAVGSGLDVRVCVDSRTIPLYIFKTAETFADRLRSYVTASLAEGLAGWEVVDCVVCLTQCGYSVADGPPSRRGPTSTAADFRKLTPIVLRQALERAGTVVCEPVVEARLEVPEASLPAVLAAPALLGIALDTSPIGGGFFLVEAVVPASAAHRLQGRLAGMTGGEGVLEATFRGYAPVRGARPVRGAAR